MTAVVLMLLQLYLLLASGRRERQRDLDRTYRRHRIRRTDPAQDDQLLTRLIKTELERAENEYEKLSRKYCTHRNRYRR